jgi:BirA family biotin operon repressor/biotin-[acetyl-CoA-carboxylase] ligase
VAEVVGGKLKEPNDVLLGGHKVAGILGEAREEGVVLGIGVNVHGAPSHVPATSLSAEGLVADRAQLLADILAALERRYDQWLRGT